MSRSPINNPVIIGPENEELFRAFEGLIVQLEEHFNRAGQIVTLPIEGVTVSTTLCLIPRVGRAGFNLGRVSFVMTGSIAADASNYWTFTLSRYFTAPDGVRTKRAIPGSTWNTSAVGIRPFVPKVVEMKRPLDPGESLIFDIEQTGAAIPLNGTVQVQEMFGPEE